MSRTRRVIDCTPEDVFAVLEDGWTYGMWVVGSARIRRVDPGWPAAGTRIHHSVGAWPMLLSDDTRVEEVDAPHSIQLRVRAWPGGEARVRISCAPTGDGRTEVVMDEQVVAGPARLVPRAAQDLLLHPRNVETLRRLGYVAEHRAGQRS